LTELGNCFTKEEVVRSDDRFHLSPKVLKKNVLKFKSCLSADGDLHLFVNEIIKNIIKAAVNPVFCVKKQNGKNSSNRSNRTIGFD
jgi:hypothetical protein